MIHTQTGNSYPVTRGGMPLALSPLIENLRHCFAGFPRRFVFASFHLSFLRPYLPLTHPHGIQRSQPELHPCPEYVSPPLSTLPRLIPVAGAIGVSVAQSALYDVPGGYRAVIFDRFQGVKPQVSCGELERGARRAADVDVDDDADDDVDEDKSYGQEVYLLQAVGTGTHFLIPGIQRAILYDVRIKPRVCILHLWSGGHRSSVRWPDAKEVKSTILIPEHLHDDWFEG